MRRRFGLLVALFLLIQVFAAGLAGLVPATDAAAQEITCDDFNDPEAAQALLDADNSFEDALDPDGDGDACTEDDLAALEEAANDPTIDELDGRLGGERAGIEEEFGEQTNDEDEPWPVGAEYDVDGFRRVSIFYHRDYAAYVILTAERRSPFTQSEAEEIAVDFLPEDFEQGDQPVETEDGDLLIPGHSEAMERRFGEGTYARYGAEGEQGDVHFILRLDADNDVSSIEIGLGLAEQTGPEDEGEESDEEEPTEEAAPAEDEEPTPEQEDEPEEEQAVDAGEYVATVRGEVETLLDSIDEFFALIGDPDFGSDESIDQLSVILAQWAGASSTASGLTPPEGFEDAHELYLEFTDLLLTASSNFLVGISDGDDASITAAGENLDDARTTGETLLSVLEDAENARG
jgi:hypothetical protein